jgi:hypothetical protein
MKKKEILDKLVEKNETTTSRVVDEDTLCQFDEIMSYTLKLSHNL